MKFLFLVDVYTFDKFIIYRFFFLFCKNKNIYIYGEDIELYKSIIP